MNRVSVARRCTRHPEREAAAKCRSCSCDFCRECATEHEGVILCATCLAKEVNSRPGSNKTKGIWVSRIALVLAIFIATLFFYTVGNWLLKSTEQPNFNYFGGYD